MCCIVANLFVCAVATARATADPAHPLRGALMAPVAKHHAAITDPVEFGTLLRSIEVYSGQPVRPFVTDTFPGKEHATPRVLAGTRPADSADQ